jgi:hypothetical protein
VAACRRYGSDRRVLGDPPSNGADFDAAPEFIRQIKVDAAVVLGEADGDVALRTIELGLRLKHIERCVERSRARRIPGPLVLVLAQPGPKALAAQRPGFPVTVDDEIRKADAVACLKEPGGLSTLRRTSVLLTTFDRSLLGLWQPDRTAIPSYRQRPRQLIESAAGRETPLVMLLRIIEPGLPPELP